MTTQNRHGRFDTMAPAERASYVRRARAAYLDPDVPMARWDALYRPLEAESCTRASTSTAS